jgi:hypothetical protein
MIVVVLIISLGYGPINDALTMAKMFIERGYKVVYLMDATPKEVHSFLSFFLFFFFFFLFLSSDFIFLFCFCFYFSVVLCVDGLASDEYLL